MFVWFAATALGFQAGWPRHMNSRQRVIVEQHSVLRSVCKIYVTIEEPDYEQPWSGQAESEAVGSGFIVEDGEKALRVLTNAHVVRWATEIRVRRHGETRRAKARLIGVGHECDLALLAVEDASFWEGEPVRPLSLGDAAPELFSDVAVVGYPMGGDNVCVTRGVVSRVDAMSYTPGAPALLVVQIDAAVNSGNSGGPAVADSGSVVGVAFQGYAGSADNIGYIIPVSVVQNFLATVQAKRGRSSFFVDKSFVADVQVCTLGITCQPAENEALRASLKMDADTHGVLVTRVAENSCAPLVPGDVLLDIGGNAIADDGTVALREDERVDLAHASTSRRAGEHTTLTVFRNGQRRTLDVTFRPVKRLVSIDDQDHPRYLVVAGLVLMPLTVPLLEAAEVFHDSGGECLHALHSNVIGLERSKDGPSEIVVWTSTLTTDANFGYSPLCRDLPVLASVNGQAVNSLRHVHDLLEQADKSKDPFYTLIFKPPNARPREDITVVLNADLAAKSDAELLRRSKLPALSNIAADDDDHDDWGVADEAPSSPPPLGGNVPSPQQQQKERGPGRGGRGGRGSGGPSRRVSARRRSRTA